MTGLLLDLIVVILTVLLVLFGVWRGMYKLIFGLISSVLALVLTIVLANSVTTFVVDKTTIDDRIGTALDTSLAKYIPNGNMQISYYDIDGDGNATELGYEFEGKVNPFSNVMSGSKLSFLSNTLESVVKARLDAKDANGNQINTSVVLIEAVSATLVGYIMLAIVAVVLFILLVIVIKLLMSLLKKLVTKTYLGYFMDKLLGGVVGLAIAALIVFGALTVIKLLGTYEWIIPVNALIESSTLTKVLYNNNFLYAWLTESFNLKGIIDNILSKISAVTKK